MNCKSEKGETPLHVAAARGHDRVVEVLLKAKADIRSIDSEGNSALHKAAKKGREEVVRMLLQAEDDIAKHEAAKLRIDGEANVILEAGINLRRCNRRGETPFYIAVREGKVGVARIFLQRLRSEEVNKHHPETLHAAARSGNKEMLQILLETKIDVKCKDKSGFTAFVCLDAGCGNDILRTFLENGATIDEQDGIGTTLLHKTAAKNYVSQTRFLFSNGADVKKTTTQGDTALHSAASGSGREEVFRLLLEAGADLEARNLAGYTPFHQAVVA